MTDKSTSEEDNEKLVIGKITDITSPVIGSIIIILEFLKIKVPKTAENPIGIIVLLVSIYSTGGLFSAEFLMPMIILSSIIILVFFEIFAYNKPKISQFFSKNAKAEKIINKIKYGNITPDEAYYEIFRFSFDADNIDKLIKELSNEGFFTSKIQEAIINSQKLYIKNLKTYFGKDTDVRLDDKNVIEILKNPECYNSLSEEQIKNISEIYGTNDEIILILLYTHVSAKRILKNTINQSVKLEYSAQIEYSNNPFWLNKYLKYIPNIIKIILIAIYFMLIISFILMWDNFNLKYTLTDENMGVIIVSLFVFTVIVMNFINNITDWMMEYIHLFTYSKRHYRIQNYKNNITEEDISDIFNSIPDQNVYRLLITFQPL